MNIIAATVHLLLVGLPAWLCVCLLWVPLFLIGVPLCAWLTWRQAWHLEKSKRYPFKHTEIAVWNARWANYFWGNDEDGVTGDMRWWPAYCAQKSEAARWQWLSTLWATPGFQTWWWCAWRNGVNNYRFTQLVDIGNERLRRIRYVGNSADCHLDLLRYRKGELGHRTFWFYAWTGPYGAFWIIRVADESTHRRLRLGWKFTPAFRNGVPAGDYREQSESFTPLQIGWQRKG